MSLNKVLKTIKQIGESNKFISSFYFGEVLDYTAKTDLQHSSFVCTLMGGNAFRTQFKVRLGLSFFDWCEADNIDQEQNVWSDQLLILQDVLAALRDTDNDWDVSDGGVVTFFKERYEDSVAGCQTEVEITFDYEADRCAIPNN